MESVSAVQGVNGLPAKNAERWSNDAQFFEYSKAANPIGSGQTPKIPIRGFSSSLHEEGPTGVIPLDLSDDLGIATYPATSSALLANFIKICSGERVATSPNATSELYYVLRGSGFTTVEGETIPWSSGDVFTLPASCHAEHYAYSDSVMYWVTDEPLLRYLGVTAVERRFNPTKFAASDIQQELDAVASDSNARRRSRISVLLANSKQMQTMTITHVLWAMIGLVPAQSSQAPHRHQSVALDLCVRADAGCYTLLGTQLNSAYEIVNPIRMDWAPGSAFTTPPGMWHAHFNESDTDATIVPIQDAGLQTYLRSLDIRFVPPARVAGDR
jgi:gentisate 1,2-dioxygenase